MAASHTPTPWRAIDYAIFAKSNCISLTDTDVMSGPVNKANAAFIVRACNAHDDLVAALKSAEVHLAEYIEALSGQAPRSVKLLSEIKAALAKVEAQS